MTYEVKRCGLGEQRPLQQLRSHLSATTASSPQDCDVHCPTLQGKRGDTSGGCASKKSVRPEVCSGRGLLRFLHFSSENPSISAVTLLLRPRSPFRAPTVSLPAGQSSLGLPLSFSRKNAESHEGVRLWLCYKRIRENPTFRPITTKTLIPVSYTHLTLPTNREV